jgi:integrase
VAFYGGLRAGEIQGLRWDDVDLAGGVMRLERAYDPKAGEFVEPKSRAGRRTVPIPAVLRDFLLEHRMRQGRRDGLVFGRDAEHPFTSSNVWRRARTAWKSMNAKRAKSSLKPLEPIGLHEARHTFASLMIAAGVNAKALSTFMGHSSIQITLDRYGHLMPGSEEEAAELLDAYLERANTKARLAQLNA